MLIYSIRKENKELARSIARQIRAECPKENERELKRLFNIALNLKSIEEKKEEIEQEERAYNKGDGILYEMRAPNRMEIRELGAIPLKKRCVIGAIQNL